MEKFPTKQKLTHINRQRKACRQESRIALSGGNQPVDWKDRFGKTGVTNDSKRASTMSPEMTAIITLIIGVPIVLLVKQYLGHFKKK